MKTCGNCHGEVPKGEKTCPRCGTEVRGGFLSSLLGGLFGSRSDSASSPPPQPAPRVSAPQRPSDNASFAFEVEDVFSIAGRGTVATGRVIRGAVAVGDDISFLSAKGERVERRIAGIEAFRKLVDVAKEGDTVGLLFGKPVPLNVLTRGVIIERGNSGE